MPKPPKYKGATKTTKTEAQLLAEGLKKGETIGSKTYYDKEATPAISGGVPGSSWRSGIIKMLESGVSPEELSRQGHIDPSRMEEFRTYYKPVYTEPESIVQRDTPLAPYAGTRKAGTLQPKRTASQDWDEYTFSDIHGQANKSETRSFKANPATGIIEEYDPLNNKFLGKSFSDYSQETVRSDAQGQTMLPNTLGGLPVIKKTDEVIVNDPNKRGTVASGTSGGFKKGGIVSKYASGGIMKKVKGYQEGGFTEFDETDPLISQVGASAANAAVPGSGTAVQVGLGLKDYITSSQGEIDPETGKFKKSQGKYVAGLADAAYKATPLGMAQTALDPNKSLGEKALSIGTFGISDLIGTKRNVDSMENKNVSLVNQEKAKLAAEEAGIKQQEAMDKAFDERKQYLGYKMGGRVPALAQKCSMGGKIEGKGTSKSDSIDAKVKEGSYIVPAENRHEAMEIRKKVLKAPSKKKAELNQNGGDHVKLSDGEVLFTPEENEVLLAVGIDLDDLAPHAEHGNMEMNKGGLTAAKAKIMLHEGKIRGKDITDQQRKFFGAVASGQPIRGYKEGGKTKKLTRAEYDALSAKDKRDYDSKQTQSTTKKIPTYKRSTDKGNGLTVDEMSRLTPKVDTTREQYVTPERSDLIEETTITPTTTSESVTMDNLSNVSGKSTASKGGSGLRKLTANEAVGLTNMGVGLLSSIQGNRLANKQIKDADRFLAESGPRPVDTLDKDFISSVDKAKAAAQYGFTPEEAALAKQSNLNLLNTQRGAARNYSGGSASNAYNMERNAINESFGRGLKSAIANKQLQMEKQAYADALVAQKKEDARRLFSDTMEGWQQNQKSGAALKASGLRNKIEGQRYRDELLRMGANTAASNNWLSE